MVDTPKYSSRNRFKSSSCSRPTGSRPFLLIHSLIFFFINLSRLAILVGVPPIVRHTYDLFIYVHVETLLHA